MRPADWDGRPPGSPVGWSGVVPVGPGDVDGDGDRTPDTVVVPRARGGAWVFTDTDGDGFADLVLDLDLVAPDDVDEDTEPGVLDALARLLTGQSGA